MANVKFYRLGLNGGVSNASYLENKVADGRIIFALVKDENNPELLHQYIWANGIEYEVNSGISNAHIDVSTCDPEVYFLELTPAHGDYYVKEEVITEKEGAEPRRTAYIYNGDSSVWQVLDGNVDATNVFFKDGVDRTAAIGVLPATTGGAIKNEGKEKNLKELLEYYLVGESFPKATLSTGSATFEPYGIQVSNLPNNIKSYITIDGNAAPNAGTLVEIGKSIEVAEISGTLTCSSSGTWSTSKTAQSHITNMNFGYCTSLGTPIVGEEGHYTPDGSISSSTVIDGESVTSVATYNNIKTTNLTVNATLTALGTSTTSATTDSTYDFATQSLSVVAGTNSFSLSLTHDATVSRSLSTNSVTPIDKVYVISNKNHVAANETALVGAGSFGNSAGSVTTYTTTNYYVKGVYPIYTNGTKNTDQTTGMNDYESNFKWSDNNTYHGLEATSANYTKWTPLLDGAKTIYINVNDFTGGEINNKPIIFIPSNLGVKINTGSSNLIPAAGTDGTGKIIEYSAGSLYFQAPTTVSLNNVDYDMYVMAGASGPTSLQVSIVKK